MKTILLTIFIFSSFITIGQLNTGISFAPQYISNTEFFPIGFYVEGNFQWEFSKLLYLQAGLNYDHYPVFDTPRSEDSEIDKIKKNYVKGGIPVLIGLYLNGYKSKHPNFRMSFYSGYQISISLPGTITYYPVYEEELYKIKNTSSYSKIVSSDFIHTFILGLDFENSLSDKFKLSLSPQFRYTFIDSKYAKNGSSQQSGAMQIGMRYKLN